MRQVLRTGALGRPRGIRWRGRWEAGSGWGIRVNPWLIHVNVWQKPLQYCKVISLQLIKINGKKNESRAIITDLVEIKRITEEYYEQLYAHKFDNLDDMDQFFERHNLPKLKKK